MSQGGDPAAVTRGRQGPKCVGNTSDMDGISQTIVAPKPLGVRRFLISTTAAQATVQRHAKERSYEAYGGSDATPAVGDIPINARKTRLGHVKNPEREYPAPAEQAPANNACGPR